MDTVDLMGLIEETYGLIAPYVERDPTKLVSFEEFCAGKEMLERYMARRMESVRGQISGTIPSTKAGQAEHPELLTGTDGIDLHVLGDVTMGFMDGRQDLSGFLNMDTGFFGTLLKANFGK